MDNNCGWRKRALSTGLLLLRILMGLGMAYHGYAKVFGGDLIFLIDGLTKMGMPAPTLLAWLAALSEFVGGILIALGLGTRVAAFFVFFTMGVAFFKAHAHDPFQIKEMAFLYGSIALSLIFTGGGCYSLEALFCCRKCEKPQGPS